ncbi:MAG: biopolymer transporter ExbD [Xanthomonadales bacterium]|nr:biopolymer transporter ExbD [Xanthomonadales bacterium]
MRLQAKKKAEPQIELAPLIDVVFLLLIFFMVTTTFERQARLRIDLPEASEQPATLEQERLEIAISEDGRFFVDNNEVVNRSLETLKQALEKAAGSDREQPVTIRADANTPHQAVVTAMDAVNQAGFVNLSIATTPSEND